VVLVAVVLVQQVLIIHQQLMQYLEYKTPVRVEGDLVIVQLLHQHQDLVVPELSSLHILHKYTQNSKVLNIKKQPYC
jgi:hypothetical protein